MSNCKHQQQVLQFIRDRMVYVYGENPNYDYMINLDKIISQRTKTPSSLQDKKEGIYPILEDLVQNKLRYDEAAQQIIDLLVSNKCLAL